MVMLAKGRLQARLAETPEDILTVQRLRYRAFIADTGAQKDKNGLDQDPFDQVCNHVMIEDISERKLLCCFRMMTLNDASKISDSYSAQYYELSALKKFNGPMVEMGRFCIDPLVKDPNVLRLAWAAMTKYVDDNKVELLFGCSSFKGTDEQAYADSFAMLRDRYLGPKRWLPRVKAPKVFRFAAKLRLAPNPKNAMRSMPPLLKTYLLMGGWVSDHAVIDRHMNTLHVFTGVEIRSIPPARKRLLRAIAG